MRIAAVLLLLATTAVAQDRLYPPNAVIDVTSSPYNAKPDDGLDDTKAIQQAITDNIGTRRVLYFPAGVYDISDTLVAKDKAGHWCAMLTLQGQSRTKTVIRLADGAAGFAVRKKAKAMIMTGSGWEPGDSLDGGGNKAFCNNIFDLALDLGAGNPAAMGIEYAASNCGAIQRVTIRSKDGFGGAGIALTRRIPGPCLIKDVEIEGLAYGIEVRDGQYGITMENIVLKNQIVAGIRMDQNLLHIRKLTSENKVPAIQVTAANGVLTLIDSSLKGGAPDAPAIECAGTLFLRKVAIEGYQPKPIRYRGENLAVAEELALPHAISPAGAGALLTAEEVPEFWNADLTDWEAVGPRQPGEIDDTGAMQRAMDSNKGTVYFPNNRTYFLGDTVTIRGAVRQVLGLGSEISLGAAKEPFSNVKNPRPLFRIDPVKSGLLVLDGLFFNAQYGGEVLFENNAANDVVIQHCAGWVGGSGHRRSYRNTSAATGRLFLEDVFLPGWDFQNQRVWARQFNPENPDGDGITPQVSNVGGHLWILGFKTEGPAPFIATAEGGTTELLGAYNYISATNAPKVPENAIPYIVKGSSAAFTFTTDNFRDNDYKIYIQDDAKAWTGPDLLPRNGHSGDHSYVMPLYRSH